MAFDDLLNKVAVVKKRTITSDYGSDTSTFSNAIDQYSCRVYTVKPYLMRRLSGEEVEVKLKAMGAVNSLIEEGGLLVVDGVDYRIVAAVEISGAVDPHHMEMGLEKV